MWNSNCPLLLNHQLTVFVKLSSVSLATPIPDYYRPAEWRNHLKRTCLTKWRRLKDLKKPKSFTIYKNNMRNKVIDIYPSGKGYKDISIALALQRVIIHKWRRLKTVLNLPRSSLPTKITLRAHCRLIKEVTREQPEQHLKNCRPHLSQLRSEFIIQQ